MKSWYILKYVSFCGRESTLDLNSLPIGGNLTKQKEKYILMKLLSSSLIPSVLNKVSVNR